jgi:ribose 5-phosphate isomerase
MCAVAHARGPACRIAALGIPLATLDTVPLLDVAIDGSDEVRG